MKKKIIDVLSCLGHSDNFMLAWLEYLQFQETKISEV